MSYKVKLNRIMDEIFRSTNDSLAEMARKSGLCYGTVLRLNDRITQLPRFKTVWSLAQAYGFDIEMVKKARKTHAA